MLDRQAPTRFQNVEKADDIRIDVRFGVGDRIANARLRPKIDDDFRTVFLKERVDFRRVGEIAFDERKTRKRFKFLQSRVFQIDVVDIVVSDDRRALRREFLRKMISDKPGRAGD